MIPIFFVVFLIPYVVCVWNQSFTLISLTLLISGLTPLFSPTKINGGKWAMNFTITVIHIAFIAIILISTDTELLNVQARFNF